MRISPHSNFMKLMKCDYACILTKKSTFSKVRGLLLLLFVYFKNCEWYYINILLLFLQNIKFQFLIKTKINKDKFMRIFMRKVKTRQNKWTTRNKNCVLPVICEIFSNIIH